MICWKLVLVLVIKIPHMILEVRGDHGVFLSSTSAMLYYVTCKDQDARASIFVGFAIVLSRFTLHNV